MCGALGGDQCLRGEGCCVQGRHLGVQRGTRLCLAWESITGDVGEGAVNGERAAASRGSCVGKGTCRRGLGREERWDGLGVLEWEEQRGEEGELCCGAIVDGMVIGKVVK